MIEDLDALKCGECDSEPRHWWWIRTDNGMLERLFCDLHMGDNLISDRIAFEGQIVYGSEDGEL
jgi:hypothetical protein